VRYLSPEYYARRAFRRYRRGSGLVGFVSWVMGATIISMLVLAAITLALTIAAVWSLGILAVGGVRRARGHPARIGDGFAGMRATLRKPD